MSSSSTGSSLGGGVDAAFPTSTASSWDFEKSNTTEAVIDAAVLQSPTEDVSELMIPDGGVRAWLIVFGAMCNNFSTWVLPRYHYDQVLNGLSFGLINSWGTFQAYYEENLLSDSSPSSIAWIGSVQYSLTFLPGLLAGRLFDLGYFRHMISTSSILIVVATFLIPECKEYWQFLLCQGFAVGIGSGGIYSANVAVIAHWFKLRRGLVMGWTTAGSAVGGIFFPVVIRALLQNVGFSWCMRYVES
ncbi:hypothetical protein V5O48_018691 [Marasmius crinis-equi]|uniref:Major facilitator superfamily (MFS) profile domain-containing protein n=1 Tax=Marasmius crinis-equi TaxID=585013 RepID=A0ABR3EKJ3_9AGAR